MWPEEIKNKQEEQVCLIAGEINATGRVLYWIDKGCTNIGDYAVVENKNGYDLVKIIGKVITTKKEANKFSNTKYENMKSVVIAINKNELI